MAAYSFITCWHVRAPIEAVWKAIFRSERWPSWWKGLERVVELEPGDPTRVGCIRRFVWKGRLPYRLVVDMRVTRIEPPVALESIASGELEGTGRWRLSNDEGGTKACYEWNVRTAKRWMNRLAPIARPFFQWNHDVVMRAGERGLRRLLETAAGQ